MDKKYPIHETLDNYKYRLKRNEVLRAPDKMTFDPEFAAIQYEHKMIIANTSLRQYFKYNNDVKFILFFSIYILIVAICLFLLYLVEDATII
tara:strand:- start:252 stop:527 length:276 start_codon:yes stop_codon:yes gene_type:complete